INQSLILKLYILIVSNDIYPIDFFDIVTLKWPFNVFNSIYLAFLPAFRSWFCPVVRFTLPNFTGTALIDTPPWCLIEQYLQKSFLMFFLLTIPFEFSLLDYDFS
ncbi:hypothetical protein, partial [Xanthovirga aplysinae]|uniref:hypothetical protein n=1 Tax=Xanthovirga aplysinae TaxID=2529853 RepID=UPI001CA44375